MQSREVPKLIQLPCRSIVPCSLPAILRPILRLVPTRAWMGPAFPMLLPRITVCAMHAKSKLPDYFLDEQTWKEVVDEFARMGREAPHRMSTRVDYVAISEEETARLLKAMTEADARSSLIRASSN